MIIWYRFVLIMRNGIDHALTGNFGIMAVPKVLQIFERRRSKFTKWFSKVARKFSRCLLYFHPSKEPFFSLFLGSWAFNILLKWVMSFFGLFLFIIEPKNQCWWFWLARRSYKEHFSFTNFWSNNQSYAWTMFTTLVQKTNSFFVIQLSNLHILHMPVWFVIIFQYCLGTY